MPKSTKADLLLTRRQRQVLHLLSKGLTHQQAANKMRLSPATISHHVSAAYAALDTDNLIEACIRSGFLRRVA